MTPSDNIRLDLFDAGAPAGGAEGSTSGAPVQTGPPGESARAEQEGGSSAGLEVSEAQPEPEAAPEPEDRRAKFEALIQGEYRDLFEEQVQRLAEQQRGQALEVERRVQAARRQLEDWQRQAGDIAQRYPGFDLGAEAARPEFLQLLRAGVPMRQAYEVLHLSDIRQDAAQKAEARVTQAIRAKQARPGENGAAGSPGVSVKQDPSKLTRAGRAEIARRAAQGERICF